MDLACDRAELRWWSKYIIAILNCVSVRTRVLALSLARQSRIRFRIWRDRITNDQKLCDRHVELMCPLIQTWMCVYLCVRGKTTLSSISMADRASWLVTEGFLLCLLARRYTYHSLNVLLNVVYKRLRVAVVAVFFSARKWRQFITMSLLTNI